VRWEVVVEGTPKGVRAFPDRRFWRYRNAVRYALILNDGSVQAWLRLPDGQAHDDPIRWTVRRA
jgi:hypothetical protein